MRPLDWAVIALYLGGIVTFALYRSRRQADLNDYYLAGRQTRWWQSGFSTMATQLGAISFVSAPAFVALKEGGGLKWLAYEFGVPLGLLLVMMVILPFLHRGGYISIYEYLERRFDRETRVLVSLLFQLGRGLATAVTVLAGGLILSTALPLSTAQAIILIGAVTVAYDVLGGIRVVILSDVVQMIIIVVGVAIGGATALAMVGWDQVWVALDPERLKILDFRHWGLSPEGEYAFWPMAIGGIFLYASYYGCDQSQVQREMSVGSLQGVRRSLLVNAFGRFPIVLLYCLMGVFVGAVFADPEHISQVAARLGTSPAGIVETLGQDPDRMVPMYVLTFLPPGVVGLIFVAIMAALMSSLDSAINSLSAVTLQDVYRIYIRPSATKRHYLLASKLLTLFWGIFCVTAALAFGYAGEATRHTTIVLINAVGSLLYGPILAAFLLGMTTLRISPAHIKPGIMAGITANVLLWQFSSLSWMWWNLAGFLVAVAVSAGLSYLRESPGATLLKTGRLYSNLGIRRHWNDSYSLVVVYFFAIIAVAWLIQWLG
ncbi:MAG: sodium/solute symporter [Fidelibacterota bacterium]